MTSIYKSQPWKTLYLVFQAFSTAVVRVPLWILLAIPAAYRPRRTWTIKRTILLKLLKHAGSVAVKTGNVGLSFRKLPNHLAIAEGANVKGVWVSPTPDLIVGDVKRWASEAGVECARIPGYWLEKDGANGKLGEAPVAGEKVVYALHGGGYVTQSAHPNDPTSNIPRGILERADSVRRAFMLEYRLSAGPPESPVNPFPTALVDAVAGYNYLVKEVGFAPENIVVEGDSAGGNLALALVRYLVENHDQLGDLHVPGGLILCSPWADIGDSDVQEGSSIYTNIPTDYINVAHPRARVGKNNFLGPLGYTAANTNRYISPGSVAKTMEKVSFQGFPRTIIIAGGAEVLLDQIRTLRTRMAEELGETRVDYFEAPDGIHDFIVFLWHEPERSEALARIVKWIELK